MNNFSEHTEQVNLVNWARKQGIFIFSVPNGFKSSAKACVMMKQEGLLSGVPDLIACFPNGKAVFLEQAAQAGGGCVLVEVHLGVIPDGVAGCGIFSGVRVYAGADGGFHALKFHIGQILSCCSQSKSCLHKREAKKGV